MGAKNQNRSDKESCTSHVFRWQLLLGEKQQSNRCLLQVLPFRTFPKGRNTDVVDGFGNNSFLLCFQGSFSPLVRGFAALPSFSTCHSQNAEGKEQQNSISTTPRFRISRVLLPHARRPGSSVVNA